MNCPHCKQGLNKKFFRRKVLFQCPGCGGQYATISAVRGLCGSKDFAVKIWIDANASDTPGVPCPECGKPTAKITPQTTDISGIELDVCTRCQGVWFDCTELESLPLASEGSSAPEIPMKTRQFADSSPGHSAALPQASAASGEHWKYLPAIFGMPVERCQQSRDKIPYLTWGIAAVCIAVFLICRQDLQQVIANWGFVPALWRRYGGATLITSMFLHTGIRHLVGNMYFLLVFGDDVENEFGHLKYALLFFFSGLSASFFHLLWGGRAGIPCVGASGFISGIILCYAICFPKADISFFCIRYFRAGHWFSIPAWAAALLWFAAQIFMAIYVSKASGTAYFAHIGGAAAGIISALIHYLLQKRQDKTLPHRKYSSWNIYRPKKH